MVDISREQIERQIKAYEDEAQRHLFEHQRFIGAAAALRQLNTDIDGTNHAEDPSRLEEVTDA